MNVRVGYFLSIVLALSTLMGEAQTQLVQPLTLRDAVTLVLSRNPALVESSHGIEASRARAEQARSPYRPSAAVEASYVYLAPVSIFSLPNESVKVYPADNYDAHVGVRQTIFDFAKTGSQVDAADARTTVAEDSRLMLQRDLAFATAQDFYAILFLRRSVDVQDEEIRTLLEHQDNAHKRYEGGTATQLDELTTQVRVAGAQTGRINLVDQLRTQEIAFRALADLPGTDTLALAGDFAPPSGVSDPESLRTVALATRIEAKTLRDMVASAQLQQRADRRTDAPSLNAAFSYGVKNGFIPNLDVWRGNFTLAVGLMYPILDGGRTSGMEEEAFATLQATEAKQRETDIAISSDVARANASVAAALEKIRVSETNIRQAELAVKTARLRYDAGTVSNLDLLDAETDLSQAKLNHLQALYDGVMSNLQRRRALGLSATE